MAFGALFDRETSWSSLASSEYFPLFPVLTCFCFVLTILTSLNTTISPTNNGTNYVKENAEEKKKKTT